MGRQSFPHLFPHFEAEFIDNYSDMFISLVEPTGSTVPITPYRRPLILH